MNYKHEQNIYFKDKTSTAKAQCERPLLVTTSKVNEHKDQKLNRDYYYITISQVMC